MATDLPTTEVFLINRFGHPSVSVWSMADVKDRVSGELRKQCTDPEVWATEDGSVTVYRFAWVNVGRLPEDHLGVGVAVA